LLLFRVDPRLSGYSGPRIVALYQELTDRIEVVPGVRSAAISRHPLLAGGATSSNITIEGSTESTKEPVYKNAASPNFCKTMEIPILLGRDLSVHDDANAPKVAVINQAMARRYFPDQDPVGKRFWFAGAQEGPPLEIVGVARDAKYTSMRRNIQPTIYTPYAQENIGQVNFSVRVSGDVFAMIPSIRDAVREIDSNLPLYDLTTQTALADASVAEERLFATLSSFFGLLALLLGCVGLYGVMSYGVARRTNEIGIRMALGATSLRVTRMVMLETMILVLIGVVIGVGGALAVTRFIASMLFGLKPTDAVTIVGAALLMIAVAAVAGYLPARRAALVDPMVALRDE